MVEIFEVYKCENGISIEEDDPELEFNKANKLGDGGEATVYKAVFRNEKVAIKVFKEERNTKEMELLQELRHPNIIELLGTFYDSEKKLSVILKLAIGTLEDKHLQQSDAVNCKILCDAWKGLEFLHKQHYVHLHPKV